jgi:hypothetical protein
MMSNTIKFKTILTKEDFVKASRGYLLSQTNNQILDVLLVLLILGGVLGLILNGIEPSILVFVVLATVGLVYSYFISPAIAASTVTQNAEWSNAYDWSVSEEDIVINSRAVGAKIGWVLFQDFLETRDYFLLVHSDNKKSFQIIPKRAFKSADQEGGFRQLLKARFEKQRKPFWARNGLLAVFLFILVVVNVFAMYILGKNR